MINLTSSQTSIKVGARVSRDINFRRGVKQGDPLSPLLFNLVVDELISNLNTDTDYGGTIVPGVKVAAMAFADDIVLLEDNEVKLPLLISKANLFMKKRGMMLNPKKCCVLVTATNNKRVFSRTKTDISVDGTPIRNITSIDSFRYLGFEYAATGIMKPNNTNLSIWLSRLERAPLKPDQKYHLLKFFVLPRLFYGLQSPRINGRILRETDRLIKYKLKHILHVSGHTPDHYLYARTKDGGLGIPHLRYTIPNILLKRLMGLESQLEDLPLKYIIQSERVQSFITRLRALAGVKPPEEHWRERIATAPYAKGIQCTSDDLASRVWLDNKPRGWSGRDYVRAVQLRTNNLATVGLPSNPVENRKCRGGCNKVETLCHVLQGCRVSHWPRVQRHNEAAKKVAKHCRDSGWEVLEEPHVRHRDGTLYKPDIVLDKGSDIVICDVQVSWEGDLSWETVYKNKKEVYDNNKFKEAASIKWPNREFSFYPLILGHEAPYPG